MKAKIFAIDLLPYRPYPKTQQIDAYYARVASQCLEVMEYSHSLGMNEGDARSTAIMMALYLEDVVSGLGIWQTFTEEIKARYGAYLPFYAIDESNYIHEEVNVADVCFMLWHRLQLRATGEATIINPLDPNIAFVAESIMTVLDQAYEEAPENEALLQMMQTATFGDDDFIAMRNALRWLHYGCYLFAENQLELSGLIQQLQQQPGAQPGELMRQMAYSLDMRLTFDSSRQLLSLSTPQWAEKIFGRHADAACYQKVKSLPMQTYRYAGTADDDYLLEEVSEAKTVYHVTKLSADLSDMGQAAAELAKTIGEDGDANLYVTTHLVEYAGKCWVNGFVRRDSVQEANAQLEQQKLLKAERDSLEETYKNFLENNDGDWLHFCKSKDEVPAFFTDTLKYDPERSAKVPPLDDSAGVMIYCTPHAGIGIVHAYCYCVAHPANTFYDQTRAKEQAIGLLVSPEVLPYEACLRLQEEGLLPDAAMKSILGEAHGRELVEKNASFITDYFYHTYPEREKEAYN